MKISSVYKTPEGEKAVIAFYDSILKHWPVPHQTLSVDTRHGDTFIIVSGLSSSPPLVLLHGAGTNSSMWAGDVVAYSQDFSTYAVDLLGE
ncbi:MAG: hypothetical protein J2P37_33215, partial [Ktedonobacteraceae bacterium]|nr:hypothetical protein [Ktedonobacteraceae bacterium]